LTDKIVLEEALDMMYEEFIMKHWKIDPIFLISLPVLFVTKKRKKNLSDRSQV